MSYIVCLIIKSLNMSIESNWFKLLLFWNKILHLRYKKWRKNSIWTN